jgi:hypothetical protein
MSQTSPTGSSNLFSLFRVSTKQVTKFAVEENIFLPMVSYKVRRARR